MQPDFQKQLIDARRQQILDAAIAEIAERGFQRTTIKQIAKRAGVADGTIYNYFKNKDAILLAIASQMAAEEVRELHFSEAAKIPFDLFVTTYFAHRMSEVMEQYDALKVVTAETIVNEKLRDTVNEQIYAPSFAVAERYFEHLMAAGNIAEDDPKLLTRLFAALPLGVLFLRMMGDTHVTEHWNDYAAAMSKLLIGAFGDSNDEATKPDR